MTPKDTSTLIKLGVGLGAAVWAGPQILAMLFVLLFLGLFAGVVVLAMAATLIKYALLVGCGVGAVMVISRLIKGPAKRPAPTFASAARAAERKKRLEKASLDLELAKAVREARR